MMHGCDARIDHESKVAGTADHDQKLETGKRDISDRARLSYASE
jgi:hypothetical protein